MSDTQQPCIAVVGSTMIDLVAYVPQVPTSGETLLGDSFQMGFGGKGANQAVMASLLGADVTMVNCLGDDSYGEMYRENFARFGIDTSHVQTVPGASGVASIWVEADGSNRIIIIPGANHALTIEQASDAIHSLDRLEVVIGQFEIPQTVTTAAFATARQRGSTTILNPAPAADLEEELLANTDWLILNETEFALLAGEQTTDAEILEFWKRTGTRLVVTLGKQGVAMVTPASKVERFSAQTVTAVDTTGAGDAFVGAFAYGLASGLDDIASVQLGMDRATDSVTRPGTQTSYTS
ncbi:MAG: ribokinase [Proteobacteria bacterium]|nr:ribokinase [Pseudomonadota bacterium]